MKHNNTLNIAPAGETAPAANPATTHSKFSTIRQGLLRKLLRMAGNPTVSVVLWDGQEISPVGTVPVGRIVIRSRSAFVKLLSHPDLQFGDLYSNGQLEVEGDLVEVMEALTRALPPMAERGRLINALNRLYLLKRNTLSKARDNIYHHYDIGNAFYQLWLDEQMVYTCAYFPSPALTLEQAQIAKLEHVCRKLQLKAGETVVEAGCGWGALALHMARHYDVTVKAYNISKEQLAYAREQACREGLAERVEFIEGDYRQIQGTYDVFVSIGMLEHVGLKHYGELGDTINRCLKSDGRGLIHTIGRNRPAPMSAWIEKRIFPGAYPPSLGEMMQLFEPWRFSILDVENLRLHYAETLRHWLVRYDAAADQVQAMFDIPFVRAWRLYLAGSIAAFTMGELQLFQVVFTRPQNNALPRSREFLYRETSRVESFSL
ncbi:MAG: cyclopropane-fatty-acyl-phospholipid synthase family protein [Candidatus Competibacteraceae bacterium]